MFRLSIPDKEYLNDCFVYDSKTGKLYWKTRPISHFEHCKFPERYSRSWNTKYAGTLAINSPNPDGYLVGHLNCQLVQAHRIIFKLVSGDDSQEIDHVNGIRSDNRFENLRSTTRPVNMKNKKVYATSKSGITGVLWKKNKWQAQIKIDGKCEYLGRFENKEEAIAARKAAEVKFKFHENHGKR